MNEAKPLTQTGKVQSTAAWTTRLAEVLAEITGSQPVIRPVPLDKTEEREPMIWWRPAAAPAVWVAVSEADAGSILRMRKPDLPPADSGKAAFSEVLERSWGPGESGDHSPVDVAGCEVYKAEFPDGESLRFFVSPPPKSHEAANLDILMDIELPITLRFGSTQMALRDIAGLSAGSIIEFDRAVDEPVDVMVNGHLVARGEAVVVQGSYGVRISEISSRRERLLTSSFPNSKGDPGQAGEQIG